MAVKVPVQSIGFQVTSPITVWDNRDGGNVVLEPGYYMARPQLRENLTLYYVYKADEHYVPQGYEIYHAWLRVDDDSSVVFGE